MIDYETNEQKRNFVISKRALGEKTTKGTKYVGVFIVLIYINNCKKYNIFLIALCSFKLGNSRDRFDIGNYWFGFHYNFRYVLVLWTGAIDVEWEIQDVWILC